MVPNHGNKRARGKDTGYAPHAISSRGMQKVLEIPGVVNRCRQARGTPVPR